MGTDADGVIGAEIKVTLSGPAVARALEELDLQPGAGSRRDIYFFDEVEGAGALRLFDRSIVLRLRLAGADENSDSTAKLRPALLDRLVGPWSPGSEHDGKYRAEFDWAARPVLAASLQAKLSREKAQAVATGERPLAKAFSDEQEQFLAECGPVLPDLFEGLSPAGPVSAVQWEDVRVAPFPEVGEELKAELWDCGAGLVFLELSARVARDTARHTLVQLRDELRRRGLEASPGLTKTEQALRHLLPAPAGVVLS